MTIENAFVPILGFVAWSGTGKTTLLLKLVPILTARGVRIGLVKHAHHNFEIDYPGKDSYELRKAGAAQVLATSRERWALMVERVSEHDPRLDEALLELDQGVLDLILVEGFKDECYPKIELHRPSQRRPAMFQSDANIIAVASDDPSVYDTALPVLDLNDPELIADFVQTRILRPSVVSASA